MLFCAHQDIALKGHREIQFHNEDRYDNLGDSDVSDNVESNTQKVIIMEMLKNWWIYFV